MSFDEAKRIRLVGKIGFMVLFALVCFASWKKNSDHPSNQFEELNRILVEQSKWVPTWCLVEDRVQLSLDSYVFTIYVADVNSKNGSYAHYFIQSRNKGQDTFPYYSLCFRSEEYNCYAFQRPSTTKSILLIIIGSIALAIVVGLLVYTIYSTILECSAKTPVAQQQALPAPIAQQQALPAPSVNNTSPVAAAIDHDNDLELQPLDNDPPTPEDAIRYVLESQ
jgi:hypothetical protein